jgi:hypothetical protein
MIDITVQAESDFFLVRARTEEGRFFLDDNVSCEVQWWGSAEDPAMVIEQDEIWPLMQEAQLDGLEVIS